MSQYIVIPFSDPSAEGWQHGTLVRELIDAKEAILGEHQFPGPYVVVFGGFWQHCLREMYISNRGAQHRASSLTVQERVMELEGIEGIVVSKEPGYWVRLYGAITA